MFIRISKQILFAASILAGLALCSPKLSSAQELKQKFPYIRVEDDSGRFVLGQTEQATVSARIFSENNEPLPGEDFRFHVNVGRMSNVTIHGDGSASADYLPPDSYYPQWAIVIVTATAKGKIALGIHRIALHGLGEVSLFSKPKTKVYLKIGDKVFGPETTDETGKATIPVVAPPGMKYGSASGKKIDLALPPMNRISIAAESDVAIAGATEPIGLWIYCTDTQGNPLGKASLSIESGRGTVTNPVEVEAGVYRAEYTAPTTLGTGQDSVSVSLSHDPASTGRSELSLVAGHASRVTVELTRADYQAGQPEDLLVTVSVMDKEGNPAAAQVAIESDWGQVEDLRNLAPGQFVGKLDIPDRIPEGRKTAIVRAVATDRGNRFVAEKTVSISPGPPAEFQYPAILPTYQHGQEQPTRIPFTVVDPFDNPVPNLDIQVNTSHSEARVSSRQNPGDYVIEFLPDRYTKETEVTLGLKTNEFRSTVRLEKKKENLFSLSPRVGYLTNFSKLNLGCVEVSFSLDMPRSLSGVFAAMGGGYYFTSKQLGEKTYRDQKISYESIIHLFPLVGSLGYRFRLTRTFSLFLTGGAGVHFLLHRLKQTDSPAELSRTAAFRAHGHAGSEYIVGPGKFEISAGYIYTTKSGDESIDGRTGGLQLLIGYKYTFMR